MKSFIASILIHSTSAFDYPCRAGMPETCPLIEKGGCCYHYESIAIPDELSYYAEDGHQDWQCESKEAVKWMDERSGR